MTSARRFLASLLRRAADRLEPPRPQPPQPKIGGLDLSEEEDAHRSDAALGLVENNVIGWVLVSLREERGITRIQIKGFVPKNAYAAFAETMRRIKAALER